MSDELFLRELEPKAAELLERHLHSSKEWFPHKFVPWAKGAELDVEADWDPRAFPLPDAIRSALFVNLLTEDNLPYYYATINRVFSGDEAWGEWNRRWTAEEGRHAIVIRDYLTVTQAIDPVDLERARMAQVSGGMVPEPETVPDTFAYVALQELATRIAHRNTGKMLDDPAGYAVMARVATDENFHYLFYRDMTAACLEADPSTTMMAIDRQVRDFEMPGTGIANFEVHSRAIADAGIYDIPLHYEQILVPVVMRHWDIESLTGLSPEAEQARERCIKYIGRLGKVANRITEKRAEKMAMAEATAS